MAFTGLLTIIFLFLPLMAGHHNPTVYRHASRLAGGFGETAAFKLPQKAYCLANIVFASHQRCLDIKMADKQVCAVPNLGILEYSQAPNEFPGHPAVFQNSIGSTGLSNYGGTQEATVDWTPSTASEAAPPDDRLKHTDHPLEVDPYDVAGIRTNGLANAIFLLSTILIVAVYMRSPAECSTAAFSNAFRHILFSVTALGLLFELGRQQAPSQQASQTASHRRQSALGPKKNEANRVSKSRPNNDINRRGQNSRRAGTDDEDSSQGGGDDYDNYQADEDPMACPFYVLDPIRYHNCGNKMLRTFNRVKQHLRRDHCIGEFYCPICYSQFTTKTNQDEHIVARTCDIIQPESLTSSEFDRLGKTKGTNETRWRMMWEMCFPAHPQPVSPYMGHSVARYEAIVLRLAEQQLPELVECIRQYDIYLPDGQMTNFVRELVSVMFRNRNIPQFSRHTHVPAASIDIVGQLEPGNMPTQNQSPTVHQARPSVVTVNSLGPDLSVGRTLDLFDLHVDGREDESSYPEPGNTQDEEFWVELMTLADNSNLVDQNHSSSALPEGQAGTDNS